VVNGYAIEIDGKVFDAWRSGVPFTLADTWRETRGLRNCKILSPTGRVLLDNAGSSYVRNWEMPTMVRALRFHAGMLRRSRPDGIRACPHCGLRCYRTSNLWNHPPTGCGIEAWHVNYEPRDPRLPRHPFEVVAAGHA
jgi:hypothetical protein